MNMNKALEILSDDKYKDFILQHVADYENPCCAECDLQDILCDDEERYISANYHSCDNFHHLTVSPCGKILIHHPIISIKGDWDYHENSYNKHVNWIIFKTDYSYVIWTDYCSLYYWTEYASLANMQSPHVVGFICYI